MAKPKEGKEKEFYLSQIRELKSENRNLKKRLKQLERREHHFEELDTDPEPEPAPKAHRCPECNKGTLIFYNVAGRMWNECDQCNYRSKTVKV